jgi:hypothetical protein
MRHGVSGLASNKPRELMLRGSDLIEKTQGIERDGNLAQALLDAFRYGFRCLGDAMRDGLGRPNLLGTPR